MGVSLEFAGAAGTVTGSRTSILAHDRRVLIDCGLFQGGSDLRARNRGPLGIPLRTLDAVVLTHAHLDHSGWLPVLVKQGWRGPIHCSEATADLLRILLLDAAHLEQEQALWANRTHCSSHDPAEPLFTTEDAELALSMVERHERATTFTVSPHVSCRLGRAGHILGASWVEAEVALGDVTRRLVFSGDVGHDRSLVMKGPDAPPAADVMVLESTYGDRLHPRADVQAELAEVAQRTFARRGVLVIPAFAVGRAQELIYRWRRLEDDGLVPVVPVILDSPMSAAATDTMLAHPEETVLASLFAGGKEGFAPRDFRISTTSDDSMLATMMDGPMVVISAAGMLNGGRILHHLRRRLPDARNTVLFVGWQAVGTKGRFLQEHHDTEPTLRIHKQEVAIAAEVATLSDLSAHGDADDLIAWLRRGPGLPGRILLNHGEPASQAAMAERLRAIGAEVEIVDTEKAIKV
jgi:metallo-beta-lactamase family protein